MTFVTEHLPHIDSCRLTCFFDRVGNCNPMHSPSLPPCACIFDIIVTLQDRIDRLHQEAAACCAMCKSRQSPDLDGAASCRDLNFVSIGDRYLCVRCLGNLTL